MSQGVNNMWGQIFGQATGQMANIIEQHETSITQMQRNFVNIGREIRQSEKLGCDCTGCVMIRRLNVADDGVRLMPEDQAQVQAPVIKPPTKNGPADKGDIGAAVTAATTPGATS